MGEGDTPEVSGHLERGWGCLSPQVSLGTQLWTWFCDLGQISLSIWASVSPWEKWGSNPSAICQVDAKFDPGHGGGGRHPERVCVPPRWPCGGLGGVLPLEAEPPLPGLQGGTVGLPAAGSESGDLPGRYQIGVRPAPPQVKPGDFRHSATRWVLGLGHRFALSGHVARLQVSASCPPGPNRPIVDCFALPPPHSPLLGQSACVSASPVKGRTAKLSVWRI
jgi:hypothetical protein